MCFLFTCIGVFSPTVPCVPEALASNTSCSDNLVTMTWASNEAGELYTVTAFSVDGNFFDSCSGFSQSCDLTTLKCGVPYIATVTAQDSICTSPPSVATTIRTGIDYTLKKSVKLCSLCYFGPKLLFVLPICLHDNGILGTKTGNF